LVLVLMVSTQPSCVRRTAKFTTVPEGARVYLNDEDVGRTPVTVDFTWYGDYDVVYRLDGYETVKTNVQIKAPFYQWFPLDFFSEVLWPLEIHDHHEIAAQELVVREPTDESALRQRAAEYRDRTLYGDELPPEAGP
jgi:hypothetical protein